MSTAIETLYRFISQRPGLEFGNYCSDWRDADGRRAYRAEVRAIGKDLRQARELLRACELAGITDDQMIAAARGAYSGRLSIVRTDAGAFRVDYCTGQYWPTEYRRAVCAVAAAALWDHYRDDFAAASGPGESPGHAIRHRFARHFGRSIAQRWFN